MKAHAWKACLLYGNEGSNPSPSSKAQEARFLNNQAGQGYIQLTKKPTTIAMYKFKEGKLSMTEKTNNDVTEEAVAATAAEAPSVENVAENAAAADAAFGV